MMKTKIGSNWVVFASILLIVTACNNSKTKEASDIIMEEGTIIYKAICVVHPTLNNNVTGLITFTRTESGISVVADIEGLSAGKHGFHIHEFGDCSNPDGTSAGGHFNPENIEHGSPADMKRHVGDLGNIIAGEDGKAHYEILDHMITFEGKHNILGRGIIIHAGEDDLMSQPTGDAGGRVACGVIGVAK